MQFEFRQQTPKALANFSPGLELATTLGLQVNSSIKPCKGSAIGERFQRFALISNWVPRVVASSNPGLKLANAFGVNCY
jgi:hypothetical protein